MCVLLSLIFGAVHSPSGGGGSTQDIFHYSEVALIKEKVGSLSLK